MKQVTVTLHFDDDRDAEALYEQLKDLREQPEGIYGTIQVYGSRRNIREVTLRGPNDH